MSDAICITGMGLATCLGLSADEVWERVKRGECGIGKMTAMESALPAGADGGQAPELPPEYWPALPREARFLRWVIEAAMRQARVQPGARVALILGTTLHGMRAGGTFLRTGDYAHLSRFLAGDTARLATEGLDISGLRVTTCSACSSSLGAVTLGETWLASDKADVVLAGGYDPISEYAWAGFNALRVVSGPPLRPFAKGREGMKLAEGYGILALERQSAAFAASKPIFATISGWGETADAFHLTRPDPTGAGALLAMRQAMERASLTPTDLGLVAAHATGTIENDASEAAALTALLAGEAVPAAFRLAPSLSSKVIRNLASHSS